MLIISIASDDADQALALLGRKARPSSDRANANFNAVFAEALFLSGQVHPARQHYSIKSSPMNPDNAAALSARARLLSSIGESSRRYDRRAAPRCKLFDTIADYRVLLAKIYRANDDARGADRTLWDGYRDLPAMKSLYSEVRRGSS